MRADQPSRWRGAEELRDSAPDRGGNRRLLPRCNDGCSRNPQRQRNHLAHGPAARHLPSPRKREEFVSGARRFSQMDLGRIERRAPRRNGPRTVHSKLQPDQPGIRGSVHPPRAVSEKAPGTVRHNDSRRFLGHPFWGVESLKGEDDHHGRDQAQAHTRSSQAEVVRPLSPTAVRPVPGLLPERPGGESCDSVPKGLTGSPWAG